MRAHRRSALLLAATALAWLALGPPGLMLGPPLPVPGPHGLTIAPPAPAGPVAARADAPAHADPQHPADADTDDFDPDSPENAFLGGPDPPCMLPCACCFWLVLLIVAVVALAAGLVLTGVLLAAAALVLAAGAVLALALVQRGAGLVAALALLPVVALIACATALARRRPAGPP